jgi:hypothetical protein
MKESKRLGGWQCWVEVYEDHVIKEFKTKNEIKEEVRKFLKWKGRLGELNEWTERMLFDIENSTKIIKNSKIPSELLANLEFLRNNKLKQKKVVVLREFVKDLDEKETKSLIVQIRKFLLTLWKYGIHEKTFKVLSNLGYDNGKIVLIDPFEITSDKKKVLKQLKKKQWQDIEKYKKDISEKMAKYLIKELDKTFTKDNLDKHWKSKK